MKFCQSCDNLLYLRINDGSEKKDPSEEEDGSTESAADTVSDAGMLNKCELNYYCRMCNEVYPSDESDSCVFNINFNLDNIKKNSFINDYIYDDITLPRAEGIKCPNSNCPDSKPEIVYIQYDKENMKFIYVCLSCHREKNEPHIW
jgi:hypothetical protein